jgi:hypothetical protein
MEVFILCGQRSKLQPSEVTSLPPGGPVRNYKHPDCYITKERQAHNVATSVKKIEINAHLYDYR